MDKNLQEHQMREEARLSEIEHTIKALDDKLDILQRDVEDLVAAWKAANWLVGFVKWTGGLAVSITAILALLGKFK
jgi:hypothetical protein